MNPTDKKANVKLSLAGGKPSTMKYNEPIEGACQRIQP